MDESGLNTTMGDISLFIYSLTLIERYLSNFKIFKRPYDMGAIFNMA
jgi:hypothetical protein